MGFGKASPVTQGYPAILSKKFFGKVIRDTLAEKKWVKDRISAKNLVIGTPDPPEVQRRGRGRDPEGTYLRCKKYLLGDDPGRG